VTVKAPEIAVILMLIGACATTPSEAPVRPLVPYVEKAKSAGPKLEPSEALRAWLDGCAGAVIRLPLTVVSGGLPGERRVTKLGALEVRVEDSALGVSFDDRVRMACKDARPCRVWVEGRWSAADQTVKVLHFSRAVAADEAADFVEREDG
jgi:hypothetical protein